MSQLLNVTLTRRLMVSAALFSAVACSAARPGLEERTPKVPRDTRRLDPPRPDGTVTSGGGLLHGAKANPWFLAGQSPATWCVEIDSAAFSLPAEQATSLIEESLSAWQEVTKVEFKPEACKPSTDLRFLLGRINSGDGAALRRGGMHHSSDLKSAAALAVQTAYDKSALRGRGFIYMSPDVGPRALAGAKSIERPWSRLDGQLFKVTILHELGHVAGLQHNAEANGLMGARTIEYLVDRDSVTPAEADPAARARFDDYVASLVPGSLVDFPEYSHFERCTSRDCTRLIVSRRSEKSVIVDVWKAPAGTRSFWSDAGFTLMGSMELNAVQTEPVILSRIFKDKNYEPSITGQKVRFTGRYVANDGAGSDARPATMTWTTGNAPQLQAFDGHEIITIFE